METCRGILLRNKTGKKRFASLVLPIRFSGWPLVGILRQSLRLWIRSLSKRLQKHCRYRNRYRDRNRIRYRCQFPNSSQFPISIAIAIPIPIRSSLGRAGGFERLIIVNSRICQTFAAFPAEPGNLPLDWLRRGHSGNSVRKICSVV